jgi:hypothetical protein
MQELVEWQIRDKKNGMPMCWFTHPSLEYINGMDLSYKNILMFGAGLGDAWLSKLCKKLVVIERNEEWIFKSNEVVNEYCVTNIEYIHRPCNDSSGNADYYLEIPEGFKPDVIINDDAYRTECCQMAVDYFTKKNGGGILISDNWCQAFVWISPKAFEIMMPYEAKIFEQADHTNNDGINKWKTAIHFIK